MVRFVVLGLVCSGLAAATALAVVDRDRVTISATRLIAEDGRPVILSGQISSRRSGELVIVEQDDCGPIPWHRVLRVLSGSEGGWRSNGGAEVTARFRVRWRKIVSRAVTIKARPYVTLEALSVGFKVKVAALHFFQGRVALLQRFGTKRQVDDDGAHSPRAHEQRGERSERGSLPREGAERSDRARDDLRSAGASVLHAGFSEPQSAP